MFEVFRQNVKKYLKNNKMTYYQLGLKSDLAEGTIKCFMSGANDSRRVAERIADALGKKIIYSNGKYQLVETERTSDCNERNQNI